MERPSKKVAFPNQKWILQCHDAFHGEFCRYDRTPQSMALIQEIAALEN